MARPFPLVLDQLREPDRVAFAIVPIDAFSGAIVAHGVKVTIVGQPALRPIRNLSGMHVFLNIPDADRAVKVEAGAAGYFDSEVAVAPPADPDDDAARRHVVALLPRPGYPFAENTTLVRGVLVKDGQAVAGGRITAQPAGAVGLFEAQSDAGGAFVMPLRLPDPDDSASTPVNVSFKFPPESREFTVPVRPARTQSFKTPIDLDETVTPELVDPRPRSD